MAGVVPVSTLRKMMVGRGRMATVEAEDPSAKGRDIDGQTMGGPVMSHLNSAS